MSNSINSVVSRPTIHNNDASSQKQHDSLSIESVKDTDLEKVDDSPKWDNKKQKQFEEFVKPENNLWIVFPG
jgi:hypothetical protein